MVLAKRLINKNKAKFNVLKWDALVMTWIIVPNDRNAAEKVYNFMFRQKCT